MGALALDTLTGAARCGLGAGMMLIADDRNRFRVVGEGAESCVGGRSWIEELDRWVRRRNRRQHPHPGLLSIRANGLNTTGCRDPACVSMTLTRGLGASET